MRGAIETVLFWAAAVTGSSVLILVLVAITERCAKTSLGYFKKLLVHIGVYREFLEFMIKRRREGRT